MELRFVRHGDLLGGERRIEVTLMVYRENDRAALKHALTMNYPEMKKQPANDTSKVITNPVINVHR